MPDAKLKIEVSHIMPVGEKMLTLLEVKAEAKPEEIAVLFLSAMEKMFSSNQVTLTVVCTMVIAAVEKFKSNHPEFKHAIECASNEVFNKKQTQHDQKASKN